MTDQAPQPDHHKAKQQTIDPWNVQGEVAEDGTVKAIDYNRLVEEFGTKLIDQALLDRFEKATGQRPHHFMRRGIVFSHRDLELILDRYENGEPFFLYTGRGPSSDSMHIGHTIPFEFTKWLQDVFDVPLVIMITDDEKFLFRDVTIEQLHEYTRSNVKDIIAVGFDSKKTFIFSDYEFMGGAFYRNVSRVSKCITFNAAKATFGFDDSSNIGRVHFGAIQGATAFASTFPHIFGTDEEVTNKIPCLIPCAIDQDPYFRLTRHVAQSLKFSKPALIHARFLDALQGPGSKMSGSIDTSAIFMKDTSNKIKNKINKYAYSGGQETAEEQRKKGADTGKDVAYQYLTFFLEDDEELEDIRQRYSNGELMTGEVKARCIQELQKYIGGFQERRSKVTDEVMKEFMTPRPLAWTGNPRAGLVVPVVTGSDDAVASASETASGGPPKLTQNQMKKLAKQKMLHAKKAAKARDKAAAAAMKEGS